MRVVVGDLLEFHWVFSISLVQYSLSFSAKLAIKISQISWIEHIPYRFRRKYWVRIRTWSPDTLPPYTIMHQ